MIQKPTVSVRDLASMLNVSVATVSRALNNRPDVSPRTRARVLELADKTGYMPVTGRRPSNVIGLVYPREPISPELGNFESAMLSGVLRGVQERCFDVTLISVDRDRQPDESFTQFFRRKGVRGVIVRTITRSPLLAEAIAEEGFPCVMIADRSDRPDVNFIYSDSRSTSERGVAHLLHLGHTRIALGVHSTVDSDHQDRLEGYLAAHEQLGLEVDRDLVVSVQGSMEGGAMAINRVLSLPDPATAIYFTDPLATVGGLHRCLELGVRVPQEFSIVGFDDGDVRYRTFPNFTAVCQDAGELGLQAARWLARQLDGEPVGPLRERHPTSFSINQSTGPRGVEPVRLSRSGALARAH